MSEPMTDEERRAIRERERAATPGPWFVHPQTGEVCHGDPGDDRDNYPIDNPEDFEFAANARTDIPRLLDEVERLREVVRSAIDQGQRGEPATIPKLRAWRESIGWHAGDFSDWSEEEFATYREMQDQLSGKAKQARQEAQEELKRLRSQLAACRAKNNQLQDELITLRGIAR